MDLLAAVRMSVSDLECSFDERELFSGLAFSLKSGEVLALSGQNGSGKSCLLRCLAGGLAHARASVCWNGRAIDLHRTLPEHVVRIGHAAPFDPALSVRDNLRFWTSVFATRSGDAERSLARARAAFGLSSFWTSAVSRLSAGQRQRAALSLLLVKPSATLWLLDEPSATLDRQAERALYRMIDRHRARGGMAIVATHSALPFSPRRRVVLSPARAV